MQPPPELIRHGPRFYWFDESGKLVGTERSLAADYGVFRDGSYVWTDIGECNHGWLFQ